MQVTLAVASLLRHRARTILAIAGVAVSAAMLLDMVMLSTGMRESFKQLIIGMGFQLRMTPKGTLPFDSEALIGGARAIIARLSMRPEILAISPVLGATVHVPRGARTVSSIALGVDPLVQGDYQILTGADLSAPTTMVANDEFLRLTGLQLGDTVDVSTGYDAQLRTFVGRARLAIRGRAHFVYLAAGEPAIALPLVTLQSMGGHEREDAVSLFMLRSASGVNPDTVRAHLALAFPRVSVLSTDDALRQLDDRLSYFRQLAFILGAVSLIVGFLLVTTLVTVSVNDRIGEIAVLRALGISRGRVVAQIVGESAAIMVPGIGMGMALGVVTGRYLNAILSAFPGLPTAVDFFLFQPRAAWTALGLLASCGIAAAIYPAWRAASLPIAATLRNEAIA
ncbi:MAG: ABC transporter permease [Gemmatimonadaceae bacterium]